MNKYQPFIDAAQRQFGELGKVQLQIGLYWDCNKVSCCYLGAYLIENNYPPLPLTDLERKIITGYNDAGYSWQEISKILEAGLPILQLIEKDMS